ncbi:hypothetical protein Pelo_1661 [Pelomyxa schiedti]|nr:hypothetical protein Pelo_1661 [Pelomyxa schiedti]
MAAAPPRYVGGSSSGGGRGFRSHNTEANPGAHPVPTTKLSSALSALLAPRPPPAPPTATTTSSSSSTTTSSSTTSSSCGSGGTSRGGGKGKGTRWRLVVLMSSGSFAPVHRMHLEMFARAKDFIESSDSMTKVVGGFLCPSSDQYVASKLGNDFINLPARNSMCQIAASQSTWIDVCPWGYASGGKTRDLIEKQLARDFPGQNITVREMHGADVVLRCSAWARPHCSWVVLGRPSHTQELENILKSSFHHCLPVQKNNGITLIPGDLQDISSTAVRNAAREGNLELLNQSLPPGVAEFMMENVVPVWSGKA